MYALRCRPMRARERRALRCYYFRQKVLPVTNCLPGALAKAVIFTTEAVGTPPTQREQGSAGSAPGANKEAKALRISKQAGRGR